MAEEDQSRTASERAGERAAKNTAVRAVAEIVGKLASLVLFIFMARMLGQSGLGVFVLAFAIVQIATMPVELGLDRLLLRRVSKDRERRGEMFDVVAIKLVLALPIYGLTVGVGALLGYSAETLWAVTLLAPGLLMDSLARSTYSVFNAFERSGLLSISLVVQRVSSAALGLAALAAGLGVVAVAATYTIGAAAGLAVAGVFLHRRMDMPRPQVQRGGWRPLSVRSLPFAAQDVLGVMLAKQDAVILSLMATSAAVGRYGAAYRLLEATFFLSTSINGAFVAMYAYLDTDTEPTVSAVFQRSIRLALAALVPCAVTFAVLAEQVCTLFFGAGFADAAGPLRLLAPAMVLLGIVYLGSSLVVSRRNPRIMVWVMAVMVALNIALNVVLIPRYGDDGAALAMLITSVATAAAVLVIAARAVGGVNWGLMMGAPLLAGVAMMAAMIWFEDSAAPALVVGPAVYVVTLLVAERLLNPADFRFVGGMVRRLLRLRPAG